MPQERRLHTYVLTLRAGPGDAVATVAVEYLDEHGLTIGRWEESWFAFGLTWRDVAQGIEHHARRLGILDSPAGTVSPHLDLT